MDTEGADPTEKPRYLWDPAMQAKERIPTAIHTSLTQPILILNQYFEN